MTQSFGAVCVAVLAFGLPLSSARCQAPVNDEPSGALTVVPGVNPNAPAGLGGSTFDNVGATNSSGFTSTCGSSMPGDVFFSFTAAVSGVHVISTCTPLGFPGVTHVDTVVAVYALGAYGSTLACDDDSCTSIGTAGASTSFLSHANATLAAGSTYIVRVAGAFGAPAGTFHLVVLEPTTAADACANATPLSIGPNFAQVPPGSTGSNPSPSCSQFTAATPDVWFTFTAGAANCNVHIVRESFGTTTASRIAVYSGSCAAPTPPPTLLCTGSAPHVYFVAGAGQTYRIRLGQLAASLAAVTLSVECIPLAANDEPPGATTLVLGDNGPDSFAAATPNGPFPPPCTTSMVDLWYKWTAPYQVRVRLSGCAMPPGTDFALYVSAGVGGFQVACDEDDAADIGPCAFTLPTAPYVEFDAVTGVTYSLRALAPQIGAGAAAINFSFRPTLRLLTLHSPPRIAVEATGGPPFGTAFNVLTFTAGAFPSGWFYGLDVTLPELLLLFSTGTPFVAPLDASGAYFATFPVPGIPLGYTLYGVMLGLNASGAIVEASPPTIYII
jgi:hypothetical protein